MKAIIGAFALALALAACGGGGETDNASAPASGPAPLTQIPAPNGDWTQIVSVTAEGGYMVGNPDAPVKLVEYGSLTCPVCGAFSREATPSLRDSYVRSGQVSWEFRHLLVHGAPDVVLAMLANCQPQGAFFRTIEQIYDQQTEIVGAIGEDEQQRLQSLPAEQRIAPLARAMELDTFFARRGMPEGRFSQCLADRAAAERLAQASDRALREDGVNATPTFLINGERQDVTSWSALEPRLQAALGRQ